MRDFFLNKTKLNENEKEIFRDNIFVGVNTEMFGNLLL